MENLDFQFLIKNFVQKYELKFCYILERATRGAVKFFGHLIIFNTLVVEEEEKKTKCDCKKIAQQKCQSVKKVFSFPRD